MALTNLSASSSQLQRHECRGGQARRIAQTPSGVDSAVCPYCGELEEIDLLDAWASGEFMFSTCCETAHEAVLHAMEDDPAYRVALLRRLGAESAFGSSLRRVAEADGQYLLDFNLDIRPVTLKEAREFVATHHEHNAPPVSWKYGGAIYNGFQRIGVVMVGRPVARMLDATTIVEANRVCVRRDLPAVLRWNACSQLYGWAARQAKTRGFKKIITYTLEDELGTTLRAAGWIPEAKTRGGSWNRPSRPRHDVAPQCQKIRWARCF